MGGEGLGSGLRRTCGRKPTRASAGSRWHSSSAPQSASSGLECCGREPGKGVRRGARVIATRAAGAVHSSFASFVGRPGRQADGQAGEGSQLVMQARHSAPRRTCSKVASQLAEGLDNYYVCRLCAGKTYAYTTVGPR